MNAQAPADPASALQALLDGNRRWIEGRPTRVQHASERRAELASGQAPMATVFTCIDSRVAPEIVFDCGIGDLAVIRTGAHVLDQDVVQGSLEFSAQVLGTPLLLVMGHESCGAVRAAIDAMTEDGGQASDGIGAIVAALRPAYDAARAAAARDQELVEEMVREHSRLTARAIAVWPTVAPLIAEGALAVRAAHYSLHTGAVTLLDHGEGGSKVGDAP